MNQEEIDLYRKLTFKDGMDCPVLGYLLQLPAYTFKCEGYLVDFKIVNKISMYRYNREHKTLSNNIHRSLIKPNNVDLSYIYIMYAAHKLSYQEGKYL